MDAQTLRIQIASDLHLSGDEPLMPDAEAFRAAPDRDLLILGGDIAHHMDAKDFVLRELAVSPVIYVPGNHEYYTRKPRASVDSDWRALAAEHTGLHYLVAEGVSIGGVRFWGTPWYSDLWGVTPHDRAGAWFYRDVQSTISDFWKGYCAGAWSVSEHIRQHHLQTEALRLQAGLVDVVITHWPPSKGACHPRYEDYPLSPYYINDKPALVREIGARLWISGHTHEAYDYQEGPTRCIGNPSGFLGEDRHSNLFRPDRVVEVF